MKTGLSDIVDFLEESGATGEAGTSPWPNDEDLDGELEALQWDAVFPPSDFSDAVPIGDVAFDQEIREIFGSNGQRESFGDDVGGSRIDAGGWDRCAWYQPIHWYQSAAGIYATEECIRSEARSIAWYIDRHAPVDRARLSRDVAAAAFASFFYHEAYHHAVEAFAIRLHVVERTPRYGDYVRGVYRPMFRSPGALEEALANAYAFRTFKRPPQELRRAAQPAVLEATCRRLLAQFASAPPGYRDAPLYLTNAAWSAGQRVLYSQIQEGTSAITRSPDEWSLGLPKLTGDLIDLREHCYVVRRPGTTPLVPTFALYRPVESRKLERALSRELGYVRVQGGKGSHVRLQATGRPSLTLPGNRKDLSPVVLRNTAKQLQYRDTGAMLAALGL